MEVLKNSTILITGGTGSFGSAFVDHCYQQQVKVIKIFSRDEEKQRILKQKYPNVQCYIGDIRDKNSLDLAMENVDYVFHAAALKLVPTCEAYPLECLKTNIQGAENVLKSAIEHHVKKIIMLSTDKAVYPISTMGLSKSYMEKIALNYVKNQKETTICITRFANLINSRGAVFWIFNEQIKNNKSVTFTDPEMTRFFMDINDAVKLIEYAFSFGKHGDILIYKPKACSIKELADSIANFYQKDYTNKIVGIRPGERVHETLITEEELPYIHFNRDASTIIIPFDKQYNNKTLAYQNFYSNNLNNHFSIQELNNLIQQILS